MANRLFKLPVLAIISWITSTHLAFCQPALPSDPFLGDYYFEDTNWLSLEGNTPIDFAGLVSVPLWGRNALLLDTTNEVPAYLNYNIVETNGETNIAFDQGAIRGAFICNWASADTNQNGAGPGAQSYLVAAGDFSSGSPEGLWRVYIDPGGTNIYFGGVSNSTETVFVSAPISWASNSIHLLGITYTSTNSTLYLDGQSAATGGPVTIVPDTNLWTNGFFVGSDASGYEQARGIYWYLEFYNSNCFDPDWTNLLDAGYFTNSWPHLTNEYYSWLGSGGGGESEFSGSGGSLLSGGGSGSCVTGTAVYMTNMSYEVVSGQGIFTFTIAGGSPGDLYDVFSTANLTGPGILNAVWTWLGRGTNCGIYSATNQTANHTLYLLGNPILADDGSGLTVAYENLIGFSSDGFVTPNAWYLSEGLNPQTPGMGSADENGSGLANWQDYLAGNNPGASGTMTIWVSEPAGTVNLP